MPGGEDGDAESQLEELQKACAGKRWLIVCDDVWKREDEMLLNCVTDSQTSKVLIVSKSVCVLIF